MAIDNFFDSLNSVMPLNQQKEFIKNCIREFIKSTEGKAELGTYIRMEIEASKKKFSTANNPNTLSYDMLTRGNVNMQHKMASNGYDVYGKTILSSNSDTRNTNVYNKMKNRINYGRNPAVNDYANRGSFKVK